MSTNFRHLCFIRQLNGFAGGAAGLGSIIHDQGSHSIKSPSNLHVTGFDYFDSRLPRTVSAEAHINKNPPCKASVGESGPDGNWAVLLSPCPWICFQKRKCRMSEWVPWPKSVCVLQFLVEIIKLQSKRKASILRFSTQKRTTAVWRMEIGFLRNMALLNNDKPILKPLYIWSKLTLNAKV